MNGSFEIKEKDGIGRYAVASCDFKPGETISSETPFAYGPKSGTPPVCLGCYCPVDCSILCSVCGWPVCSKECESVPAHKNAECSIFSKAQAKFNPVTDFEAPCPQYECITPLRVLLAIEANPKKWTEEVSLLESHTSQRKEKPIWNFNRVNIIGYLKGPCKFDKYEDDLIHTICGILDVNAFEARTVQGFLLRCLYLKMVFFSHNCVANTTHTIFNNETGGADDFSVTFRAATQIKKGEELFCGYTYTLLPTMMRRQHLKESKYFECSCARCSDPSELGTHMSSLKCTKCDNGVIMSVAPLDADAEWKCSHCENCLKGSTVKKVFDSIQADIDKVEEMVQDDSALQAREQLCRRYRSVLHPRNAYLTMLRVTLAQMYGKIEGYTIHVLPNVLLERKIELCQQTLENINIIEPGYTRLRGMILYELHAPLILLSRNLYNDDCINKNDLRMKLQQAIKLLKESSDILTLEPENSNEGMIGQIAKRSFEQLTENLEDLIENA